MYFSLSQDTQKFLNVYNVSQRFICNQVNFTKSVIVNISHCKIAVHLMINVVMA